jgi:alkylhydroperoxidase family enzyme
VAALKDEERVAAIVEDYRTAEIDARFRAMLEYLEKVVLGREVGPSDATLLREAGVTDDAAEQALFVAFAFGVMDRLADAFGFELTPEARLPRVGKMLLRLGYGGASVPG